MRFVLLAALALATASCAWPSPQQQGANCPSARAALKKAASHASPPPAAAAPVAAKPAKPAAAPAPVQMASRYRPLPMLNPLTIDDGVIARLFGPGVRLPRFGPPAAGRLTLSNFTYDLADVEALVTPYPDCGGHAGIVPQDFKLPLNATWVVRATPGADVCWRHRLPTEATWSAWNRAFTAPGQSVDSRL